MLGKSFDNKKDFFITKMDIYRQFIITYKFIYHPPPKMNLLNNFLTT